MSELNNYDFVGGHFSYQEAIALPRASKTLIILFREPFARLISFYRFHRAHPEELRHDRMVDLAKTLSPEKFFLSDHVRSSIRTNNAYLQCLTGHPGPHGLVDPALTIETMELALRRLDYFHVVGLTEHMADTIRLVSAATGLHLSSAIERANATKDLHLQRPGFSPTSEIALSDEIREAIFPLVEHDLRIYSYAQCLFHKKLARLDAANARSTPMLSLAMTPLPTFRKPRHQHICTDKGRHGRRFAGARQERSSNERRYSVMQIEPNVDPYPDARVVPIGEPIDGPALFEGTIEGARRYVAEMEEDERKNVSIWTPGHVFSAAGLIAETPGHEHDPLG